MKKVFLIGILALFTFSCEEQLNVPLSVLTTDDVTANEAFVESLIFGTYAILDDPSGNRRWNTSPSKWPYGSVASDDAHKGSDGADQGEITQMEIYSVVSTNSYLDNKWRQLYDGISRANAGLLTVNSAIENGDIDATTGAALQGELRFLRGHFHFEAKIMFNLIPFVDENVIETPTNNTDAWPNIEEDFAFAAANMSETSTPGRANAWTAKAYLAKTHMYQLDYSAAKTVLDDVINNGPYSLNANFSDNFNAATNNSPESIFAVQYAINDGAGPGQDNANYGDVLNYPHSNSPFGCCGFHQPSHDLVNAYLVDPGTGLPLLGSPITDPADYVKNVDVNDLVGGEPRNADDATFIPEARPLDPRLDHTVGRKGIEFKGWGVYAGNQWVRDPSNGGSYMAKKHVWDNSQDGTGGTTGNWGQKVSAVNTNVIRFAEILLWRAEVAASEADLTTAVMYVDMVRARAANTGDWVQDEGGGPAANYQIGLYADNGGFPTVAFAEDAILYEHRIELALEGHRFFDLVRRGKAEEVLNAYLARPQFRSYLAGANFSSASNNYYPVPQAIIDLGGGVIVPNN